MYRQLGHWSYELWGKRMSDRCCCRLRWFWVGRPFGLELRLASRMRNPRESRRKLRIKRFQTCLPGFGSTFGTLRSALLLVFGMLNQLKEWSHRPREHSHHFPWHQIRNFSSWLKALFKCTDPTCKAYSSKERPGFVRFSRSSLSRCQGSRLSQYHRSRGGQVCLHLQT